MNSVVRMDEEVKERLLDSTRATLEGKVCTVLKLGFAETYGHHCGSC